MHILTGKGKLTEIDLHQFETVRTTVTLPVHLIKWSQHFVDLGVVPSRNALIVAAVEHFLTALEREEIDRQFVTMAEDEAAQTLALELVEEFAASDWEAFQYVDEAQP